MSFLGFKSQAEIKRQQEEYNIWAFPYGEPQRLALEARMKEILPKEPPQFLMFGYLTCKEFYDKDLEKDDSGEFDIVKFKTMLKKRRNVVDQKHVHIYIALVQADKMIDEKCEYPPANEIMEQAERLLNKEKEK